MILGTLFSFTVLIVVKRVTGLKESVLQIASCAFRVIVNS